MNTLLTTPEERTPSPRKHESTATDPRPSAHPRPSELAAACPVITYFTYTLYFYSFLFFLTPLGQRARPLT